MPIDNKKSVGQVDIGLTVGFSQLVVDIFLTVVL